MGQALSGPCVRREDEAEKARFENKDHLGQGASPRQQESERTRRHDESCCGSASGGAQTPPRARSPPPAVTPPERPKGKNQRRKQKGGGAGGAPPADADAQDDGPEDPTYVTSCLGEVLTPRTGRHCGSLDRKDEGGRAQAEQALATADAPRERGYCGAGTAGVGRERDAPVRTCSGGLERRPSRENLMGDKSLRAKQLEIVSLEKKVEALMQTRTQIAARIEAADGAEIAAPAALDGESGALPLKEWVDQIMRHEEAMEGLHARSVKEACGSVLGTTNRLIELREVKENYGEILSAVDNLAQQRIVAVNTELTKLDSEVGEIEDLIIRCYEKMVDDDGNVITRERFVMFVCGISKGEENVDIIVEREVCPKDAESLFHQMSKGKEELSFEQFKDELPHGCLQVLRSHIEVERSEKRRYRDYWF